MNEDYVTPKEATHEGVNPATIHVCGPCEKVFNTITEYCEHLCEKTGFTPNEFEHQVTLDQSMVGVAQAAQQRGARTQELIDQGVSEHEAQLQAHEELATVK